MIKYDHNTVYKYDGGNEYFVGWLVGNHIWDGAAMFMELMDENRDMSSHYRLVDVGRTLIPATEQEIDGWVDSLTL